MKKTKRVNSKDSSPIVPQMGKLKTELHIFERELTEKQKEFIDISMNKDTKIMLVEGSAGTTKTWLATYCGLLLLNAKKCSDILYLRSAVESSDKSLGFLPGEVEDKMSPYLAPLLDKLSELLSKGDVDLLMKERRLANIPIGFLRGLNWNAKVVILDEAQNLTKKELVTFLTRIGEYNKVFVLMDSSQNDINGKSGSQAILNAFDDGESVDAGIRVFKFTDDDILRSELCKFIVKKLKSIG